MKSLLRNLVCWAIVLPVLAQDVQQKVAALEQQVQRHLQEQKPQLAIPILREIVSLDPQNVNGQANLGVLLFFQNKFSDAIQPLRAALQMQPGLWRIEALLGIAEKRTGNPMDAQGHLEEAFAKVDDPKIKLQAGLELIENLTTSTRFEEALSVTRKLEQLAPGNPQVLFAAYQIARRSMDQTLLSLMVAAPDSAEMHLVMAGELSRQGDRVNAISQYREAIRLNPSLPGVHFLLAEELRTSPDPSHNAQAQGEYEAALKVNPYDELSSRQLGGVLAAKGDFKAAEEHYHRALKLQPADSEAATGLAVVLISGNRSEEAIPLLENAIKEDPTNTVAHFRLSGLYRRTGRTAEAERELAAFQHYQELREKLGKVFKQVAAPSRPE